MLLDNVRDFALMPVSLGAALIDLTFKGERLGALFYQVLKWGAHSERVIDVYRAIEADEQPQVYPDYMSMPSSPASKVCWPASARKEEPPRA